MAPSQCFLTYSGTCFRLQATTGMCEGRVTGAWFLSFMYIALPLGCQAHFEKCYSPKEREVNPVEGESLPVFFHTVECVAHSLCLPLCSGTYRAGGHDGRFLHSVVSEGSVYAT